MYPSNQPFLLFCYWYIEAWQTITPKDCFLPLLGIFSTASETFTLSLSSLSIIFNSQLHQNHLYKQNIHLPLPLWRNLMQCHPGHTRNFKLISKLSVFPDYLPVLWNKTVVQKNVQMITENKKKINKKNKAKQNNENKQKNKNKNKKQKRVHH